MLQIHAVLDSVSAGEMEEALDTMPQGLDDAFEETLQRIQVQPENRKTLAMNTLMWISHASRPLLMRELVDVLAIKSSERSLNKRNRPSQRLVLECCFGLVTLDEESSVIRLVHYSVQEYLLEHRAGIFPSGEESVAEKCLRYLLCSAFSTGSCPDEGTIEACLTDYPFYRYTCRYWGHHVRDAASGTMEQLAIEFLSSRPHVARSYQFSQWVLGRKDVYWRPEEGSSCTGLHLACAFGLEQIVNDFLDSSDMDIDEPTAMGTTALIKAASGGHEGCVRMLVDRGADLTKENWYGPALHCAAEAGMVSTIEELLSSGLDVDLRDHYGRTALQCAIFSGHQNAMQSLLSRGADVDAIDDDGNGYLRMVIQWQRNVEILQMLLDNGANTELRTKHGLTALHEACIMGDRKATLMLLDAGANIHAKEAQGCTALHWAAGLDYIKIVHVLLEHGAEVDVKTNHGDTPLSFAARRGCVDSARKLLVWGADTKAQNDEGLTPLHIAIERNHAKLVTLLLDVGPNPDAKGRPEYSRSPVGTTLHPYTGGGCSPQTSSPTMQRSQRGNRKSHVTSDVAINQITANALV